MTTEPDNDDGVRLAKRVAAIVPCSRADAERYIAGGWVNIDGVLAEDPAARVGPGQEVTLLAGASADEPLPVTILLHKAAHIGTTEALASLGADTLHGDARFLKRHLHKLNLATPLETLASGLVVFTQDWRVQRKLVDDSSRIEQEYVVEVNGAIVEHGLQRLNAPARNGAVVKASWQSEARLRIAGKGILLGQVERLCAGVGLTVTALRRLRVGRLAVAGLPAGQWRYLGEFEKF
jgi:23S rRNA pseudouridine2604 synthase